MKSGYLEQLKSDIAARFERDLRKPRAKPAVKPSMEEDTALEQQKQDHFARLLMAEAVRQLKYVLGTIRLRPPPLCLNLYYWCIRSTEVLHCSRADQETT